MAQLNLDFQFFASKKKNSTRREKPIVLFFSITSSLFGMQIFTLVFHEFHVWRRKSFIHFFVDISDISHFIFFESQTNENFGLLTLKVLETFSPVIKWMQGYAVERFEQIPNYWEKSVQIDLPTQIDELIFDNFLFEDERIDWKQNLVEWQNVWHMRNEHAIYTYVPGAIVRWI